MWRFFFYDDLGTGLFLFATGTTLAVTIAALTTFSAFATLTALGAGTAFAALALHVALGLLQQRAAAEFELARLLVDVDEFHLNLVALLQTGPSTVSRRFQSISEMWSRPSLPGMNSTKAP